MFFDEISIPISLVRRFGGDPAPGRCMVELSLAERKVLSLPEDIKPSDWCQQYRYVTESSLPGRWRNETTPYLVDVMDASFHHSVETIIICAAPQTGKSEAINNCIAYAMDIRPGSVLFIYPDEQTARENSQDRIAPMIKTSPRLKAYLTGLDDDVAFARINLRHLKVHMGWARSASRLANKALPYVVFDEVDKYPKTAGKKETGPIALGEKRTRTYREMRKIWKSSSPTIESGEIWSALTGEANVIFDYWVVCPFCELSQQMLFDQDHFRFPENVRDAEEILQGDLAWYECDGCRERWDDEIRNEAVRQGAWRSREIKDDDGEVIEEGVDLWAYMETRNPIKIGFHIPSWLSYFVTLSEVAARFLKGTKDKTALKDFQNNDKAEPWVLWKQDRKTEAILKLMDARPRGVVPGGDVVACLTGSADTQDHGFWFEVRAWGWGFERESWCIREGFAPTFDSLKQIFWEDGYFDAGGKQYLVRMVVQDAMGHRTSEVYDFCRIHRGRILPLKGEGRMNQPYSYTNLEYYPGAKKVIPGGLPLLRVNTTYYKNHLSNVLEIAAADPGAWHYHSELSQDWARQMTSEYVDDAGEWVQRPGVANHAWDISVYNLAAADVLGVMYWKKQAPKQGKASGRGLPAQQARGRAVGRSEGVNRPSWMDDR